MSNNHIQKDRNNDVEISLLDMLGYVVSQWRRLLIVAVVLAILLGGYKGFSGLRKQKTSGVDTSVYDNKIADLQAQKDSTLLLIDNQRDYIEKSLLLKINPKSEYRYTAYLLISGSKELAAEENTAITQMYLQSVLNGEYLAGVASDMDTDFRYVKELISFTDLSLAPASDAVDSITSSGTQLSSNYKYVYSLLRLIVKGDTPETVTTVKDSVLEKVKDISGTVSDAICIHETSLIESAFITMEDSAIATSVDNANKQINTYNKTVSDLEKQIGDVIAEKNKAVKNGSVSTKAALVSAVKFAVLGAVGGFVVGCIAFAIIYVVSSKPKTATHLQGAVPIRVLGAAALGEPAIYRGKTGLDKLIRKLFGFGELGTVEQAAVMAKANMMVYAKDAKKVLVAAEADTEAAAVAVKALCENVPECTFDVAYNLLSNPESIEKTVCGYDAAIVLGQFGTMKTSAVAQDCDLLEAAGVPVSGIVLL